MKKTRLFMVADLRSISPARDDFSSAGLTIYRFCVFAAALVGMIIFDQALAQSPISTETIEKWNAEGREQIQRLEAEKENLQQRQRVRRLNAEKENAELHERIRQLQSEVNQLSSTTQPSSIQASSPQLQTIQSPSRQFQTIQSQSPHFPSPQFPSSQSSSVQAPAPQSATIQAATRPPQRTPPPERKVSRQNDTAVRSDFPRHVAASQESPTIVSAPSVSAPSISAASPRLSDARAVIGTIELNSSPEGATAQVSLGATCETPCSMEVSADKSFSVTFSQRGYMPSTVTVQIQSARSGVSDPKFWPNPVYAQLTPAKKQ